MPPAIALLVYTAFVLWLLWVERRESRAVSGAAWIPTVWMLSISSKSFGTWLGMTGTNEGGSLPDQLLLSALALAAVVVVARRRYDWSGALRGQQWLLALLAFQCLSTLWSDIPLIAFRRWVREAIVVIMALVVMSEASPRQALESLLRRSSYILVPMSLMLVKYFSALGREYAPWSGGETWIGVSYQKNSLAALCLVSAFFLLWALYRRWREPPAAGRGLQALADASVLFIAIVLLKGPEHAYSATAAGTLAVGSAGLLGLLWFRRLNLAVPQSALCGLVVVLISFGALAPFLGGSNVAFFSSALGRDETLTGRTDTWTELVPIVKRDPLLGRGFASFWTTARREFYRMSHGHNGYLDVLLDLGAVGLALHIVWLLSCAKRFHGVLARDYYWAALWICLLIMTAVYNSTESVLEDLSTKMLAVVTLASLVVSSEPRRALGRSSRNRWHQGAAAGFGRKRDC